jgi:hypothetical protein
MYTLPRRSDLLDREVKQIEFLRAAQVPAKRLYVMDATRPNPWPNYSPQSDQVRVPVFTALEVDNTERAGLGKPLPKGTVKVYRHDVDGRNEFIGEDAIEHTPKDETIRVYLGNAFDLTAERRRTDAGPRPQSWEQSFEIKLLNHKPEGVEIHVVEHLGWGWNVLEKSIAYEKLNASTIEFRVQVAPDKESTITYKVSYPH